MTIPFASLTSLLVLSTAVSLSGAAPPLAPNSPGSEGNVPAVGLQAPEVEVACFLELEAESVGSKGSILFEVLLEGASASASGTPAPMIQLDVPASVRLTGRHLKTFRELSRNEFIQEPYEMLLQEQTTQIPFEIVGEPKSGDSIGVNVLAYIRPGGDGSKDYFLRRRYEIPVAVDGEGEEVAATKSDWGTDEKLLQLGDKVSNFTLPRPDGTSFSLSEYIGKKNIIVSTYRAHW